MIHREYARLCAADRAVVDAAFKAAADVFRAANRRVSNTDAAERAVEALAAYLIESGGHARIGDGRNHTAIAGDIHPSYTGD